MSFFRNLFDSMFVQAGTYCADSGLWDAACDPISPPPMTVINPATNLPMIGGFGGIDIQGSPYGMDIHPHADMTLTQSFADTNLPFEHPSVDCSATVFDTSYLYTDSTLFDSSAFGTLMFD